MNTRAPSDTMATLYVENIHTDVTEVMLYNMFSLTGAIHSIHLCRSTITCSFLGSAYVSFYNSDDAKLAMEAFHHFEILQQPMRIMWSQPRQSESDVGKVFIQNLEQSIDEEALNETLSSFGTVLSCKVIHNGSGGYGFAHFETQEAADRAIDRLNGMLFNDQLVSFGRYNAKENGEQIYAGLAQKKEEQQTETRHQGVKLYIKNLDRRIDDQRLWKEFSPFGTITSAKVMMEGTRSKGFGFVCFSTPEEASNAMAEMNGRFVGRTPLYTALSQTRRNVQPT